MRTPRLKRRSDLPLYAQVEQIIRSQIVTGELVEGARIPTEKELAAAYRVSTITVRQAMLNLVDEGLLFRKQGSGTFVAERLPPLRSLMTLNVKADFGDVVPQWTAQEWRVLEVATVHAPNRIAERLGLPPGELVTRVRRTRSEEGVVISYIRHFLPQSIAARIQQEDLSNYSMLDLLSRRLGMKLNRGVQYVEAISADREIAEALAVGISSPVMFLDSTIFDDRDAPTQVTHSFYRSDRFRYTMELDLVEVSAERPSLSRLYAEL